MTGPGLPPTHGDEHRGGGMIATTTVLGFLTTVVVTLRMITRIRIVRNVGFDDYTIICATIEMIVAAGLVIVQVHYGFGRHKY